MTVLVCSVFFVSGVSALIFETLWFRQAGLAFGNSVWASTLVLSGFMGGLALGNALTARYAYRVRSALRVYTMAEVVIGLTGIGLVYLFPILGVVLAPWLRPLLDHPWILNPVRLCIAFLLLLIPSTAMGATLPLLTKALMGYEPNFGLVLGRLYGWNTLGAVTGALISETYLIGALGVHGTAITASALNMAAAVVSAWLSTLSPNQTLTRRACRAPIHWAGARRWLIAAFLSGFCLLALEVVWFRFLLWNDPVVAPEMERLGFEQPEQLGALFIGDAEYLKGLIAHSPPVVDNYPKLIEAPFSSQEEADRLFNSLIDVAAARDRFRNSPLIKRLWPERLLTESLPYFEFQDLINAYSVGTGLTPSLGMDRVHRLLTRSPLKTLVLWELGSDSDIQRVVSNADSQTLANPILQYHLGIRFLAERNYEAAVEPLRRAEQAAQLREDAFRLRNYALCMRGPSQPDSC